VLRATAATSALGNLAFAIAAAVNVVFMVRALGMSPTTLGVVLAAGSVAALAGAAFTPRLARRVGSARVPLALPRGDRSATVTPLAGPADRVGPGPARGRHPHGRAGPDRLRDQQREPAPTALPRERMLSRVDATTRVLVMGLFPLSALLGPAPRSDLG
jgi:hypothetical protein